jgi:sialate O-acetylesterase
MKILKRLGIVLLGLILLLSVQRINNNKIQVACIGDSITFGARLEFQEEDSYPAQLQQLLGTEFQVNNFGVGGCTLIRKGKPSVWNELSKIEKSNPDIAVISLGTNDTCGVGTCGDRKCWEYIEDFEKDYHDLIDHLRALPSKPKIWICAPTPMVLKTKGLSKLRKKDLSIRKPRLQELISIVKKIAKERKVGFIDLNAPLENKPELFTQEDGVHPNRNGYFTIAELVHAGLRKHM